MSDPGFTPTLWEKLMAASDPARAGLHQRRLSLEQYKASIAQSLEDLLNTRVALPEGLLSRYPLCRKAIPNYGLADFAALCLSSSEDRDLICARIKEAIRRFEPRLCAVSAELFVEPGTINRFDFVISGTLSAHAAAPAISFSAMLQPSTLRYSIRQTAPRAPSGDRR